VDLQGLWKSALLSSFALSPRVYGFDATQAREPGASILYSHRILAASSHIANRYLELARAAGGAAEGDAFRLPKGTPEGALPNEPFVLASPLAGWRGKQWPLDRYIELAQRLRAELGLVLVVNMAPGDARAVREFAGVDVHISGLPGLLYATRAARAVVGLDSGPMHLAAALGIPGVALFGPTDPARNGPVGGSFTVLRNADAQTSYRRRDEIDASMLRITVAQVLDALRARLKAIPAQRAASKLGSHSARQ
jgi:heptosyltransferase-1